MEIRNLKKSEAVFMLALGAAVTAVFYFILDALNTANMIPSTISVTTSFLAVYLTFKRSEYLCACLRRKRCCADRAVDNGNGEKLILSLHDNLLRRIPHQ